MPPDEGALDHIYVEVLASVPARPSAYGRWKTANGFEDGKVPQEGGSLNKLRQCKLPISFFLESGVEVVFQDTVILQDRHAQAGQMRPWNRPGQAA